MNEQRRHQRVRFNTVPLVRIGQAGHAGTGTLENISLGGLMLRTSFPLTVGEVFGCEFVIFNSPLIDTSAVVVNKIGDCYGARFQPGLINERLLQEAIDNAIARGKASTLSIHEQHGRKIMRVAGGLNGGLRNDFIYGLTKVGVAEIDLSGVTDIDRAGHDLCRIAVEQHKVGIMYLSPCVSAMMAGQRASG